MDLGMNANMGEARDWETGNYLNDDLLEELWIDLDKRFSRAKIREVASETAFEFEDAVVTSFLPIFIYRKTREKLLAMLDQG